tara:strand:- start:991 stop:2142 length:1152 start_codon:yes stop_codon:yes gene_type:complete
MALGDKERAKELLEKNSSETVKYFEQDTRQIHLAKDGKDGESVAFLELPKYVDEEIKKSIDVEVDELVKNRKNLPDVVLRTLYDEVVADLATANARIETLEGEVADLTAQLASMTAQRDNEKEQRIAAEMALAELENLYIALSDQFQDTTLELQRAIERSTQEAVERVSLEARFEAIKARLAASLLAIEVAEEQTELAQQRNYLNSNLLEEGNQFVWKIPVNNITKADFSGFFIDYGGNKSTTSTPMNGEEVVFYNFTDQEMTISVTKSHPDGASSTQANSIKFPSSFKISAGTGEANADTGRVAVPGVTSIKAGFRRPGGWTESNSTAIRKRPETAFTFNASNGDSLTTFKYRYKRSYKTSADADNRYSSTYEIKRDVDVSD